MKRILAIATLALCAMGFGTAAQAVPIQWTLSGVVFEDDYGGGVASGSFVYDADTGVFSAIQLTTTAGTPGTASCFASICLVGDTPCRYPSNASTVVASSSPDNGDLSNVFLLAMNFASPLSNAGGLIAIESANAYQCANADCSGPPLEQRWAYSGSVTGTPVAAPVTSTPVPTLGAWSLMLLASMVAGLALWRQPCRA